MSDRSISSEPIASRGLARWAFAALAFTFVSLIALTYNVATASGQEPSSDPVDTITDAENVPREAERAPGATEPLPTPAATREQSQQSHTQQPRTQQPRTQQGPLAPPTNAEGTTAAAMTAPSARIDFRRFGVRFAESASGTSSQTPSTQAQPTALTIAKIRRPSAASQLGLQVGDQVIAVGGEQVNAASQIGQLVEKSLDDGPREDHVAIPLVVRRNGAEQTLTISNDELTIAGYGPLLTEFGHYVPPQYVTGYRGSDADPHIPANPTGAYLGVELDSQYREAAIVSRVLPGTPAAQAGLREGDRIFAVNNRPVESPNELIYWVGQMQPGEAIEISFDRAHDVEVTLGTRAASASERPGPAPTASE